MEEYGEGSQDEVRKIEYALLAGGVVRRSILLLGVDFRKHRELDPDPAQEQQHAEACIRDYGPTDQLIQHGSLRDRIEGPALHGGKQLAVSRFQDYRGKYKRRKDAGELIAYAHDADTARRTFDRTDDRDIWVRRGLEDLLKDRMSADALYPIIHLQGEDIEIAFTHANQYGEEYYSFVNGQHTTQGGTHQSAFKEHIAKTIKEFFQKNFEYGDIRTGIVAAIALNVEEPMFESQTKIKLGSLTMAPVPTQVDANHPMPPSINKYVGDFIKQEVDNYLHKNADVAEVMLQKIQESEKERKAMAGVTKLARERAKKANLHNRKLRDCRIHYSDTKNDHKEESSIFITEGDSASGSITKSRDVNTQAVFSLRGKPLNTFGLTKKVVYENEEFNLLQAALDIEEGMDTLRYNKVIVATDADVDGMHIRLLIITFFLQFFPELIREGHVYVLQTPLFRVRNRRTKIRNKQILADEDAKGGKKSDFIVRYCYSEEERVNAIRDLGPDPEITRFKGLGEISPEEFAAFIGPDIRLEQVTLHKTDQVQKLLEYYMGKNTMERQNFIIDNLVIEEDRPEEEAYD